MKVVEADYVTGPFTVRSQKLDDKTLYVITGGNGSPLMAMWDADVLAETLCYGLNNNHVMLWKHGAPQSVN